jgi:hypothetical protein
MFHVKRALFVIAYEGVPVSGAVLPVGELGGLAQEMLS